MDVDAVKVQVAPFVGDTDESVTVATAPTKLTLDTVGLLPLEQLMLQLELLVTLDAPDVLIAEVLNVTATEVGTLFKVAAAGLNAEIVGLVVLRVMAELLAPDVPLRALPELSLIDVLAVSVQTWPFEAPVFVVIGTVTVSLARVVALNVMDPML